jgi:hypothetical protein
MDDEKNGKIEIQELFEIQKHYKKHYENDKKLEKKEDS